MTGQHAHPITERKPRRWQWIIGSIVAVVMFLLILAAVSPHDARTVAGNGGVTIGALAVIAAYWLPSIVAYRRRVPHRGWVAIINGFLGWTIAGWFIALVMAFRRPFPVQTYPWTGT
jgi:Superinfection immunity protein